MTNSFLYPFIIFTIISCVLANVVVNQLPSSAIVQEGEVLTIDCSMKEGNMGSYYMYWYKQTHDKLLKFINREGKSYGEEFKERFASELSSSNNKFSLLISSTKLADSGVYYCAASSAGGATQLFFGSGTKLEVTPRITSYRYPDLFLLTPAENIKKNGNLAACLATDFYPRSINMSIAAGRDIKNIKSTNAALSMVKKLYNFAAIVEVSEENLKPGKINCTVKGDKEINAETSRTAVLKRGEGNNDCGLEDRKRQPIPPDNFRLNFLFMRLQMLRVIFIKCIGFNLLVTTRAVLS